MRPISVTVTGVGVSAPIVIDYLQNSFNVGFSITITGVVDYTIQHTYDDIFSSTYVAANGNWLDHSNIKLVHATQNQEGNFENPIRACRIKNNSAASDGSTTLTVLQGIQSY